MSQSQRPTRGSGLLERDREIGGDGRFADAAFAAGDRDDVLDSRDLRRADSGRAAARRRRLDIDPHLRLAHPGKIAQRAFRLRLDRLRNAGSLVASANCTSHFAVGELDAFHEPERNNVAAEAGIFHRLQRFFDLFFGDRHGTGKLAERRGVKNWPRGSGYAKCSLPDDASDQT